METRRSEEKGYFRRKYPRRAFKRAVGLLMLGNYGVFESGEIGEGGMSVMSKKALPEGQHLVVSFQIPGGDFVSLRCLLRSCISEDGVYNHGLSFENIQFSHKRQIRAFVSARSEHDEVL